MPDIALVQSLLAEHKWTALAALLIGFLVRVLKDPRTDAVIKVPSRYRPLLSLGLGLAGGVGVALSGEADWLSAVVNGLVAGALAIAGHDAVVHGALDGKEPMAAKNVQ